MALPSQGTLRYDGLDFNGPSLLTQGVRSRPMMDTSGRAKSYTVHEISARLYLTGQPTDRAVLDMRRRLTTPGRAFRFEDKGFGPLKLDLYDNQDVIWGPNPRELSFRPFGPNACELVWAVSVAVIDGGSSSLRAGGSRGFDGLEINFAASFDVDRAGYTTRTLAVILKIAGRRAAGGAYLTQTADEYREQLAPPQVLGYRRLWGPWQINEAKTELRGEVIDEEEGDNAPPEWVSDVEAGHTVGSGETGLSKWTATITASYELIKAAPRDASPVKHFLGVIVRDRVGAIAQALGTASKSILPLSLEMAEPEIYGRRRSSFRFTFSYIRPLSEILTATGLHRPVPGSNYQVWQQSMLQGPANPRGYANWTLGADDDAIYDPAEGGPTPPIFRTGGGRVPSPPVGPSTVARPGTSQNVFTGDEVLRSVPNIVPTPERSFFEYQCWVWVEVDAGTIPVRTLPTKPPKFALQELTANPFLPILGAGEKFLFNLLNPQLPTAAPAPQGNPRKARTGELDNVQQRARPTMYVYLRGYAMRHGFQIPVPSLKDFGGADVRLATRLDRGEGYAEGIIGNSGVAPIYGITFNLRYFVPDPPDGFIAPLPPNPVLDPELRGGR